MLKWKLRRANGRCRVQRQEASTAHLHPSSETGQRSPRRGKWQHFVSTCCYQLKGREKNKLSMRHSSTTVVCSHFISLLHTAGCVGMHSESFRPPRLHSETLSQHRQARFTPRKPKGIDAVLLINIIIACNGSSPNLLWFTAVCTCGGILTLLNPLPTQW